MTLEAFFTDMDDCMREMGVGDLSVPKKVKKAAAGLYERVQAYRAALEADDAVALAAALERFIAGDDILAEPDDVAAAQGDGPADRSEAFAALARHAIAQRAHLAAAGSGSVLAGTAFLTPR